MAVWIEWGQGGVDKKRVVRVDRNGIWLQRGNFQKQDNDLKVQAHLQNTLIIYKILANCTYLTTVDTTLIILLRVSDKLFNIKLPLCFLFRECFEGKLSLARIETVDLSLCIDSQFHERHEIDEIEDDVRDDEGVYKNTNISRELLDACTLWSRQVGIQVGYSVG